MRVSREKLLAVSRGDAPADLVLRNSRIVNVFTGDIETGVDVAITDDKIAGVGEGYHGANELDLRGAYLAPGLIDAHVHIESSLCVPAGFAEAVVPRGVTTVIADPHEIANVAGAAGVRFMHEASRGLPLRVVLMAPSCVPATDMATAGASLSADELRRLLDDGIVHGLAEVMNFPGAIAADPAVAAKLDAFAGRPIDGHAPAVRGHPLNAYIAAGVGSDHECVTLDEAREKLARGLHILIREATNARNLDALLPLIIPSGCSRVSFCTDDRTPPDLLEHGGIDLMVRRAIEAGVEPIAAIRCATLNPAEWLRLHDRGAIAPGRLADLFVFDDLCRPEARQVFVGGGQPQFPIDAPSPIPAAMHRSVQLNRSALNINVAASSARMRVIGVRPDQLLTDELVVEPTVRDGLAVADPSRDILKIIVVERHGRSGRVGVGFVKGFGLKRGAIAGTVAHDHHNIIAVGCADAPMLAAVLNLASLGGGLQVVDQMDEVMASLPLPVAGLMSDRPVAEVGDAYRRLVSAARELGSPLHDPFMAMSFMALEVIPSLKLTDLGLVDVEAFRPVGLFL